MFERVTEHADEQVDAHAFLAARLFDVLVGIGTATPISGDGRGLEKANGSLDADPARPRLGVRHLDGFVWSVARVAYPFPQFVKFEHEFLI